MVIKLYISGISGNKEVKKKQQRVQMILDSKQISYEAIDITEPGKEKDKEFMQQNGKVRESLGKHPLPPQIFNDDDFCGDYEDFDLANEVDELEKFLHIETKDNGTDTKPNQEKTSNPDLKQLSNNSLYNPYDYNTFKVKLNCVNGLKEQIVNPDDLIGQKEQNEDVIKTEVNGESNAEIILDPNSENIVGNVEPSAEVVAPEKEESSVVESKTNDESGEKEDEGSGDDVLKNTVEKEDTENEKKTKNFENLSEGSEEKPPSTEEKGVSDDNKGEEEEIESEKEENESEEESPQSEKSQEE